MNGRIAELIRSTGRRDQEMVRSVFHEPFWTIEEWMQYLNARRLRHGQAVKNLLQQGHIADWCVQSFHALYVACWIHHPVEKGTYMLQLGNLPYPQRHKIKQAVERHCASRMSSHLSGKGHSAAKGWRFLKGYDELLVQVELSSGPHLLLKAEGHALNLSGFIPHMKSWANKDKEGEGLTASPALRYFAATSPDLVERRAAENFSPHYKALVHGLGFTAKHDKKFVTARHVIKALFEQTGYIRTVGGNFFEEGVSNTRLGLALQSYCNNDRYRSLQNATNFVTPGMVTELRRLAVSLAAPRPVHHEQVFQEIRVTPNEVDASLQTFRNLATAAIPPG